MRVWKGTQISIQSARDFIHPIQNSQNEFRVPDYENASASTARILNNYIIARRRHFSQSGKREKLVRIFPKTPVRNAS